jgi:hypothetical protein
VSGRTDIRAAPIPPGARIDQDTRRSSPALMSVRSLLAAPIFARIRWYSSIHDSPALPIHLALDPSRLPNCGILKIRG